MNFWVVSSLLFFYKTLETVYMEKIRFDLKKFGQFQITVLYCNSSRLLHYHLIVKLSVGSTSLFGTWFETERVHSITLPSWLQFTHNRLPAASINNHRFN